MRKFIVHSFLCFILLTAMPSLLAQSTQPATQPTTQPAMTYSMSKQWQVKDTYRLQAHKQDKQAAKQMLKHYVHQPQRFEVKYYTMQHSVLQPCSGTLHFPSPDSTLIKSTSKTKKQVKHEAVLEWYAARDIQGRIQKAPAVLITHSIHRELIVARAFAKTMMMHGLHIYILHAPGYEQRKKEMDAGSVDFYFEGTPRWARDARRSFDVLNSLEFTTDIHLMGISMGALNASVVQSLDNAFKRVLLLAGGAHIDQILMTGKADAAHVYADFKKAGYDGEKLTQSLAHIEPMTVVHRLKKDRIWTINAKFDQVIRPRLTRSFLNALELPKDRQHWYNADHYTIALYILELQKKCADLLKTGQHK